MNDHLVRELLAKAQYYTDHAMWLHAVQPYQRILQERPELLPVRVKLAEVYGAMNQHDAAERLLLSELKDGERNTEVLYALGMLFFNLPDPTRSIYYLEKLTSEPAPNAQHALGLLHLKRGGYRDAMTHLARCLEMEPDNLDAALALARACLLEGEYGQAEDTLRAAREKHPADGTAWFLSGCGYEAQRKWSEAHRAYVEALLRRPADYEFLLAGGRAATQTGLFDHAEELLHRACEANPASAVPWTLLGDLAVKRADPAKAQQYYTTALKLDPENTDAEMNLRLLNPRPDLVESSPPG